ncbi:MAG: carboxy terminal-processing peptidase [Myxococcota bacterium]
MRREKTVPRPLAGLLAGLALLLPLGAAGDGLTCESIPQLAREFLKGHVEKNRLTEEGEARAIDLFIRRLDSSRSLFLASEAAAARAGLAGAFDRMRKGDCQPLADLHKSLIARNATIESFVREVVEDPEFQLDESIELQLDPDERGYPSTVKEREKLLRSLVHFQMSNYLSAGEPEDEAKRRLVHRYELRTKRLKELEPVDLYAAFLDSFALSLDPPSNYLSAEVLEDFRISMSLSLEGIGVALAERDGYSVVERIIPGGAADRLENGLRPKDKIIAVAEDGGEPVNIIDMPLRDAVSLIRGKKGTRVHLTVLRQGETTERFPLAIVRDTIDLAEQAAKLRFETRKAENGKTYKLAVIELPSFYGDSDPSRRQCTDDLERLLAQVKEEGADGLVLDLSRNGGGLLEHAVKISGFFLRKGEVVGVEDSRGQLQVLSDRDERILYSGPMVVHTSRLSASASEILAGALKDYKRAVITGDDHTFGKGTVQTVTPLPPGQGALKITTALFFRPGGKSTQNDGVLADITIPSVLSAQDFGERTQEYALTSRRISPFLSSYANAIGPSDRWSRVPDTALQQLVVRSQQRVESSEQFAEVREQIREAQEADGVVKLAEILKEQAEAEAQSSGTASGVPEGEGASADTGAVATEDSDELTPQVEEALNVLADLVAITRSGDT